MKFKDLLVLFIPFSIDFHCSHLKVAYDEEEIDRIALYEEGVERRRDATSIPFYFPFICEKCSAGDSYEIYFLLYCLSSLPSFIYQNSHRQILSKTTVCCCALCSSLLRAHKFDRIDWHSDNDLTMRSDCVRPHAVAVCPLWYRCWLLTQVAYYVYIYTYLICVHGRNVIKSC